MLLEILNIFAKLCMGTFGCGILLMFGYWAIRDYYDTFGKEDDEE